MSRAAPDRSCAHKPANNRLERTRHARRSAGAIVRNRILDTYAFAVWDASGDAVIAKRLVLQQDGDRLTVPPGARLVLRGKGPGTNVTTVTRGSTGGYQVVVDGAIDANAYAFEQLGGTGQSAGLVLNGSATIVSLDHGTFDRFAVAAAGATAFVQVDAALIGAETPSRQLVGMQFDNTTGLATCNLNAVGDALAMSTRTPPGGRLRGGSGPRCNDSSCGVRRRRPIRARVRIPY